LKNITDAVARRCHHFTAIGYFGVSGGQWKTLARALPSAHIESNCSSHCFAVASSIKKDLAQVALDLIGRIHVSSEKSTSPTNLKDAGLGRIS